MATDKGRYTRYNYPYKASQYLGLGLPLIAWRGSAIAKMIEQEHCGIVIDHLDELDQIASELTVAERRELKLNAERMGKRVRSGVDFENVLRELDVRFL